MLPRLRTPGSAAFRLPLPARGTPGERRVRLAAALTVAAAGLLVWAFVESPPAVRLIIGGATGLRLVARAVRKPNGSAADAHRTAADAAPVFLWAARPDGRFTLVNKTWEKFAGRPADPDPTAAWTDAVHPDDRDRWREVFGVGRTDRRPFRTELRVREAAGDYRWVRVDGRPVFDPTGRFEGFVGSGVDVTDSRRAEADLRAGKARLRAIIDNAVDCIVTADTDGRVIEFNPAAVKTFGHTRDEALGRPLSDLLVPARDRAAPTPGRLIGADAPTVVGERCPTTAVRADGTEFPAEFAVVQTGLDGRPTFTVFIQDMTKPKLLEATLRAAKDEAEDASRAKSQFLANMSHEVRTPMAAVVGYAEMLLDPRLRPEEQLAAVHAIRRSGQHLLRVISDILDLSKIEAGRMDLERVPCRPSRLVAEAVAAAGVRGAERGVRVAATVVGPLPRTVSTDPTRVRQILDNLLSNAVKFSPPGGVVDVRVRLADRRRLVVDVTDRGIGMTSEELGRLFQPFTQADASTTRRYGGTGLGLSICGRLADALGGTIVVTSTRGAGSRFTVSLPVAAGDLTETDDAVDLSHGPEPIDGSTGSGRRLGGRVLVADDSPDNRAIVRFFLQRAGATVEEAADGREAVRLASGGGFDLVLMDMQMPEMDGYAATAALRRAGFGGPVVALTANALAGDEEKCLRAGCTAYLSKPVDFDRLLAVAAGYLPNGDDDTIPADDGAVPADLLEGFASRLPGRVSELTSAFEAGDYARVGSTAHALKGAAAMYGHADVAETAGLIEDACREGHDVELLDELIGELEAMVEPAEVGG